MGKRNNIAPRTAAGALNLSSEYNGAPYTFYSRLADQYPDLYDRINKQMRLAAIDYTNLKPYASKLHKLAESEAQKELMLFQNYYGYEGKGFPSAKELIQFTNEAFGLKDLFTRTLRTVVNSKGQKPTYTFFNSYFNDVISGKKQGSHDYPKEIGRIVTEYKLGRYSESQAEIELGRFMTDAIKDTFNLLTNARTELKQKQFIRLKNRRHIKRLMIMFNLILKQLNKFIKNLD